MNDIPATSCPHSQGSEEHLFTASSDDSGSVGIPTPDGSSDGESCTSAEVLEEYFADAVSVTSRVQASANGLRLC